jgi:hypothetical protein
VEREKDSVGAKCGEDEALKVQERTITALPYSEAEPASATEEKLPATPTLEVS